MEICSIDIGKKNFSFCIERVDEKNLTSIKNIPAQERYFPDGSPTPKMQKILEKIFSEGEIILHKNLNLTKNCDPKQRLDPETFHNMIQVLDEHVPFWDTCTYIVIEEQMKTNSMAVKLAQHCYSYFVFKYGRFKNVIEFPSYYKTQVLGAPKNEGKKYKNGKTRYKAMTKTQRKKWAVEKALKILGERGEDETIKNTRKKDDLADTFLMGKAFQYKHFVEK